MSRKGNIYTRASAAATATGNSGDLDTGPYDEIVIDIDVTVVTGTTPSMTPSWQEKDQNGVYQTVWTGAAITAAGQARQSVGPGGQTNTTIGITGRLVWTISGTTPSFTFSASVIGSSRGA